MNEVDRLVDTFRAAVGNFPTYGRVSDELTEVARVGVWVLKLRVEREALRQGLIDHLVSTQMFVAPERVVDAALSDALEEAWTEEVPESPSET